jgi:hypothetical protein
LILGGFAMLLAENAAVAGFLRHFFSFVGVPYFLRDSPHQFWESP